MFFAIFKAMSRKRYWALVVILLLLALSIHFFSNSADRVETGYATGIYPPLAAFLRHISGWIPFSIGDILYGASTKSGYNSKGIISASAVNDHNIIRDALHRLQGIANNMGFIAGNDHHRDIHVAKKQ